MNSFSPSRYHWEIDEPIFSICSSSFWDVTQPDGLESVINFRNFQRAPSILVKHKA